MTRRRLNTRTFGSTFPQLEYFYATSMHFRPLDDAPICRIPICAIVFTTNELQELCSSYPEVIQMDSTFGTNIHGYKLIHVV